MIILAEEYSYLAVFQLHNDKYMIDFPDFEDCPVQGLVATKAEALKVAKESLEFCIVDCIINGIKLPEPTHQLLSDVWNGGIVRKITVKVDEDGFIPTYEKDEKIIEPVIRDEIIETKEEKGKSETQTQTQKPPTMPSIEDL